MQSALLLESPFSKGSMALQQCSVLSPLLSKNHLIHNLTKEASQNSRTVWDALDVARREGDPTLDVLSQDLDCYQTPNKLASGDASSKRPRATSVKP